VNDKVLCHSAGVRRAQLTHQAPGMRRAVAVGLPVLVAVAGCSTPGKVVPDDMSCGTPDGRDHAWSLGVEQQALTTSPSYYYRANEYVVLLPQEVVRSKYRQSTSVRTPEIRSQSMRQFVQDILAAPALQSYQDLYAYSVPDGDLWAEILYLVVDLILEGKATVVDAGGSPVGRVIAVREKGPSYSGTAIHAWNLKGEPILRRLECIAD
jgi:hypothetical protein